MEKQNHFEEARKITIDITDQEKSMIRYADELIKCVIQIKGCAYTINSLFSQIVYGDSKPYEESIIIYAGQNIENLLDSIGDKLENIADEIGQKEDYHAEISQQ